MVEPNRQTKLVSDLADADMQRTLPSEGRQVCTGQTAADIGKPSFSYDISTTTFRAQLRERQRDRRS